MAFVIEEAGWLGLPQITATDTVKQVDLGTIVRASDPTFGSGEFIYLLGVASTAVGSVVIYNPDDYSTTLAAANGIGPIATAMSANVASQYGWYQISGKGVAKVLAGFLDDANCFLTASGTAGSIDDTDVAGDYIRGMKGASDVSGGLAHVEMWRPSVADGLDD